MHRSNGFSASTFMSVAILLASGAQAMEIWNFDKMAQDDRAKYVSELIQGAGKVLTDAGNADQAEKIENLFTTNAPGGHTSIGMSQFMLDLAKARLADAQRALQDPNAHRLEVEDAMLVTFRKNTIPLSQDFIRGFRAININFEPKSALVTQNPDGTLTIQKETPKDAQVVNGLVIPPQVVAPTFSHPQNKH